MRAYSLCAAAVLGLACGAVTAADPMDAATRLGGTFDAATGAVVVKKNKDLDADALRGLAASGKVKALTLDGCNLKADQLKAVAGMPGLTALALPHTMVNSVPNLKTLAAGLTALEVLNLGGSDFGNDGLAAVCEIKTLKTLHLGHVGRGPKTAFTADGLAPLAALPKLEALTLHLEKPDDAMIPALAKLTTLKELTLGGVNAEFAQKLQAEMPKVKLRAHGVKLPAKP